MNPFTIFIGWIIFGVVGGLIGQQHGKTGKGFILGFLFGPIGWAFMLFDVSASVIVFLCVAVVVIGWTAVTLIETKLGMDRKKSPEVTQDPPSDSDAQDIQSRFDAIKPMATPVPRSTPIYSPRAPVSDRQREALDIARKYAAPK
ncbi:hypothetical protein CfE428DRAFT_5817 [Chthoniobacter flavus Ellin428]|uniref:Uncharacterized protein n=1 Tax=Chthoniobacter flavus Ellin428 TaxID=497964 RepID=B4DA77_9BACT|nr:hypothetical protein [Chthoniobacter flavus]EDY16704.1 hypothetical protein CfE428DRAFT_5817 [Chthoniobacter flavus Ellin428]TCO87269.1 hypothetical protein EV701_123106 [Chthoniobacter flavus]